MTQKTTAANLPATNEELALGHRNMSTTLRYLRCFDATHNNQISGQPNLLNLQGPDYNNYLEKMKAHLNKALQHYKVDIACAIHPIKTLALNGQRELLRDILCFFYDSGSALDIHLKYKDALPILDEATINSYLPDLLILSGTLS
jgi:hypothetical protein